MGNRDSLLESLPRGGSDTWDNGPAGVVLTQEFFGASAVPATGRLKAWNGAAFTAYSLKHWNGSAFVEGALKHWNGSTWKLGNS